jgi:hypothetical protein
VIRRLLLLDHPTETRFFLFIGAFGIVLTVVYWILTYEVAGTVLLAGFGLGAGLLGFGLWRSRPRAMAIAAARARQGPDVAALAGGGTPVPGDDSPGPVEERRAPDRDLPGPGPLGFDTPFEDESGRLPGETLAPLSLGLGIALAITAVVFGPWLIVAGLLPLTWGAWTWLSGARDELDATVEAEQGAEREAAAR